jgi:hypothetical protein
MLPDKVLKKYGSVIPISNTGSCSIKVIAIKFTFAQDAMRLCSMTSASGAGIKEVVKVVKVVEVLRALAILGIFH